MPSYFEQRMAEINAGRETRNQAFRESYEARVKAEAERAERMKPTPRGHVYFMKSGNVVKIGHSTNLKVRFKSLQTGCAEPARIVKILAGGTSLERQFHDRFAEYRLNGEWFDLRGRLAKYLERCIHQVELPGRAPPPEPDPGIGYL